MGLCFGADPKLRSDTIDSTIPPTNTSNWIKLRLLIQDKNKQCKKNDIFDYIDPNEYTVDNWNDFYEAVKIITKKYIHSIDSNWKYNFEIFLEDSTTKINNSNFHLMEVSNPVKPDLVLDFLFPLFYERF